MRYLAAIIIIVFSLKMSYSQTHEIGVFLGASNFIGDVGATNYISPTDAAIGGVYKWNRSTRHSFRLSAIYSKLSGKDIESDDPRRVERGYEFENNIIELSMGIEFNFFDYSLHDVEKNFTPYMYTGVTVAYHDNFYFRNDKITSENTQSGAFGIPMILGVKTRLSGNLIIAFEIGARYTFSDEIDGSEPDSHQLKDNYSFGNINNNDWYVFSGFTLTYAFGRKPCYCNF